MNKLERHIWLSDFQIPEEDEQALSAVLKFIPDFKPDYVHFVGDILDLTKLSKYTQNVYDSHTFMDEIKIAKEILQRFVRVASKANKKCEFRFYSGNHEERAINYLARKAPELANLLNDNGDDYLLSLPNLLQLKKLGIKWTPYFKHHVEKGDVTIEHGDVARSKAGYTAHVMMDKRGTSGVSGHTHRLSIVFRTQGSHERFWIENGSLCKRNFTYPYMKLPDWIQGFSIGFFDPKRRIMHPSLIPIFEHTFIYGGKLYQP